MKQYTVYILKCYDKSYYVGMTNNLERRLKEHQEGAYKTAYTFKRRPLQLVYQNEFDQVKEAIAFEKQLKGWTKKKKEALISRNWKALKELAMCNNNSSHLKRE